MPTDHAAKVPYCGFESAEEAILEPSEDRPRVLELSGSDKVADPDTGNEAKDTQ